MHAHTSPDTRPLSIKLTECGETGFHIVKIFTASLIDQCISTLRTSSGDTPLHIAVRNSHSTCARILIEAGVDIDAIGYQGQAALNVAAAVKSLACIQLLVEAGALVDVADDRGATALHLSVWSGNPEIIKCLLNAGANPLSRDKGNETPLHDVINKHSSVACLNVFLDAIGNELDLDIRNEYGDTLLHAAAHRGAPGQTKTLIDLGFDVEAKDKSGYTPLHWAARDLNFEALQCLLDAGANVNATTNDMQTVFDLAKGLPSYDFLKAHEHQKRLSQSMGEETAASKPIRQRL